MGNDILLYLLKKDRAFQFIIKELEASGMTVEGIQTNNGKPLIWGAIKEVKAMSPEELTNLKQKLSEATYDAVHLLIYLSLGKEDMKYNAFINLKALAELKI